MTASVSPAGDLTDRDRRVLEILDQLGLVAGQFIDLRVERRLDRLGDQLAVGRRQRLPDAAGDDRRHRHEDGIHLQDDFRNLVEALVPGELQIRLEAVDLAVRHGVEHLGVGIGVGAAPSDE